MQKKIIYIVIILLTISSIFPDDKIIVLDIESKSIESSVLSNLKEEILLIIKKSGINLLSISDINKIDQEVFNMKPEDITEKYQNKIKKKLKTEYILLSNIELINENYVFYLNLININTSKILFILKFEEKSINEIKNKLKKLENQIQTTNLKKNDKINLVVLEVKSKQNDMIIINKIYYDLLYYLVKSDKYNVYDKISLDKIFTAANVYSITIGKKKISPVKTGELEKSELALLGNVNIFGDKYLLNYRIINIENGELLKSNSITESDINNFSDILRKQINEL